MRVLILDPDADLQRVLGNVLPAGVKLECREEASAALTALELGEPDLVILDLDIPGQAAITFLTGYKDREEAQNARVLLKSRVFDESDELVVRAKRHFGGSHFIKGPVSLLDLSDFIQKLERLPPGTGEDEDTSEIWSSAKKGPKSGRGPAVDSTAKAPPGPSAAERRGQRREQVAGRASRSPRQAERTTRPAPDAATEGGRSPAAVAKIERLLARDVKKLERADPWKKLGLSKSEDPKQVDRAVARLVKRYGNLVQDRDLSSKARGEARQLLASIMQAADKVRSRRPDRKPSNSAPEEASAAPEPTPPSNPSPAPESGADTGQSWVLEIEDPDQEDSVVAESEVSVREDPDSLPSEEPEPAPEKPEPAPEKPDKGRDVDTLDDDDDFDVPVRVSQESTPPEEPQQGRGIDMLDDDDDDDDDSAGDFSWS